MRYTTISDPMPVPQRLTEDAFFAAEHGKRGYFVVADGAGQRRSTTKLGVLTRKYGENASAARYAACLTCDVVALLVADERLTPRDMLLAANDKLREELISVYGEFSAEAILAHEPHLTELRDDPRRIRLMLPVCVVTCACVDFAAQQLTYAHAGDTALFIFYADGTIETPVSDHLGIYDDSVLGKAKQAQKESGASHLTDVLNSEAIASANRESGLNHNYVDSQGNIDLKRGVGVINGQPELADYIQSGKIGLKTVRGVLLCSDGFLWPAPAAESRPAYAARLRHMRDTLERTELADYVAALRAEETSDPHHDRYARFKTHDDATAIYLDLR